MADLMKREDPASLAVPDRTQTIWVDQFIAEKESELRKYYEIVLKRKKLVFGVAAAVLAATALWTYTTKPLYRSSVRIQIDPEQNVLPYKDMYETVTLNPKYVETQAEVLKSESLAQRVVTRLKLASNPQEAAEMARWFVLSLDIRAIENTQVVGVSYTSADPVSAATAVNALADEYVDYSFAVKRDATTKARDFLRQELTKVEEKLESSEQELAKYAREHNMPLTGDKDNIVVRKLADLNEEMTKVEAQILSNPYDAVKESTPTTFPETMKTGAMRDLEGRISSVQQKLATLSIQFGPRWPEVVTLKKELDDLQQQLATQTRRAIQQAKLEYNMATAHQRRLAAALAEQNRLMGQLGQDSIQYNIIKREVDSNRQLHDGLLQRVKEADVSAGLKAGNIHVIDRGHIPTRPYSPNIPLNVAVGLVLGLMSGVLLACLIEFIDSTVKTQEDVERALQLPFLAVIPAFEKSWKNETRGLLVQSTGRPEPAMLVPRRTPEADGYWESYRSLRASLLLSSADKRPQTILVTSAIPGEGKTTTVVNLGISLAQTGARTLIVELDMRSPQLASLFDLEILGGMSQYLAGQTELNTEIQQTGVPNLFVVPAGPIPPNPAELMGSARAQSALQLLARFFDFIVIDSPPVLSVTDARILSPYADGVLLVVQAGKTSKAIVEKARDLLRSVNARILGVLVNGSDLDSVTQYGYYARAYGAGAADRFSASAQGGV